jgi:hypothetical protein
MNNDALSLVKFGDVDSLQGFFFENGIQHRLFGDQIALQNIVYARFPIQDANVNDLEDWLLAHQNEHQSLSAILNLSNPINLLDTNWNDESSFYDWISTHLFLHEQIQLALGL